MKEWKAISCLGWSWQILWCCARGHVGLSQIWDQTCEAGAWRHQVLELISANSWEPFWSLNYSQPGHSWSWAVKLYQRKNDQRMSSQHLKALLLFSLKVLSDSVTPWTAAHQASLTFTISWSLLKFTSIDSVMLLNHLKGLPAHKFKGEIGFYYPNFVSLKHL